MKKMTYNKFNTIEMPTFILSSVAHKHYGVIDNIDPSSVQFNFNMNNAQEGSFDVKKYVNGVKCSLWEKIVSLRYVYIPEHHEYYKLEVVIDEGADTTKKCTLTSASEYELSNKIIQSLEANSDIDYADQEYELDTTEYQRTILYNPDNPDASLLHRVLKEKAPNWSIKYVAPTIATIQRTFSISKQSVYDVLCNVIGKEIECLFQFDSVNREISVYDLLNTCTNHTPEYYRGNFTDVCPECGTPITSPLVVKGYGKETGIYISYENYSDRMTVDGDESNVKNCFFVSGGDDRMTNTIKLINPTMTNYIYNFSAMDYDDMPIELVNKINDYQTLYNSVKAEYEEKVKTFWDATNNYYYYKTSMMPRSHSDRWISQHRYTETDARDVYTMTLQPIYYLECIQSGTSGTTEPDCTHVYDEQIIEDGTVKWQVKTNILSTGSASQQVDIVQDYLTHNPVLFLGSSLPSLAVVSTSVKNIAGLGLSQYFKIEFDDTVTATISGNTWTGNLKITNLNVENDVNSSSYTATVRTCTAADYSTYLFNKISTRMKNDENTFTTIFKIKNDNEFKAALREYSLDRLLSFQESYEGTLSILQQQGVGDIDGDFHGIKNNIIDPTDPNYPGLYNEIYLPYLNRCQWVEDEASIRETGKNKEGQTILQPEYTVDYWEERKETLEKEMDAISKRLDMKTVLGDEYWKMFHSYVRESDYQNSNYICGNQSDGEIFADAQTLMKLANVELKKACELQYTLSDTLKNLLNTDGFKDFRDSFELGDYLICSADDELYKLRLIQVQYKYDSPDEISVTFANTTKIQNYFSDVQSVLNQAASMTSSYQTTVHQVDTNTYTTKSVNDWMTYGLNTALTKIMNNNQEEVTYDNRGFMARVFDDVTGQYDTRQVRLTHDMLAFTDNNWVTTKTAIGNMPYREYNTSTNQWENKEGYGMISEFVTSGNITGTKIVGGAIYSLHYNETGHNEGAYIDLEGGIFSFADGDLKWDRTNGLYVNGKGTFTGAITATSGSFTGTINATGGTFTNVTATNLTATNSTFTGTVHAGSGDIGGWQINENGLYSTNSLSVVTPTSIGVGNSSEGSNTITKDGFYQTNNNYCQSEIGKYTFRNGTHYGVFVHPTTVPYVVKFVTLTETGNIWSSGDIYCGGSADSSVAKESCHGTIYCGTVVCTDTKPKLIETQSYGKRLQYAYETPTPLFGDIGEGVIDETGVCVVYIDDIFAETANTNCDYQVFLQSYSQYNCYVSERTPSYFVVIGEPHTTFGWEIKAVQRDYETYRLDVLNEYEGKMDTDNSINDVWNYLDDLLYDVDKEDI